MIVVVDGKVVTRFTQIGIQGPPGAPGADGAPGPAGADGAPGPAGADGSNVVWRGAWDALGAYQELDGVQHAGSAWVAAAGVQVGDEPGVAATWELWVSKGDKGDTGPAGADGSDGAPGADGSDGAPGADGREVELRTTATHVQWRYAGESAWTDLIALTELEGPQGPAGPDGADGSDGREVTLQVTATHVQWRLGADAWQDLIALTELQGPKGSDGPAGADGQDGADGRAVQLQTSVTHIQWRLEGEAAWTNLVALADLQGPAGADGADGEEVGLQVTSSHVQWRLGSGSWQNLIALSELQGPKGEDGAPGADGADGVGVPAGGATGQVLKKVSGTDFDTEWADESGGGGGYQPQSFVVACSDETSDLTTGAGKVTFRMPYPFTITGVRASLTTAATGSPVQVDINENGTSILSTELTIDAGEKTSTTAAAPPVISDTHLADDAEITIDVDAVGSTATGKGLKVTLIGTPA